MEKQEEGDSEHPKSDEDGMEEGNETDSKDVPVNDGKAESEENVNTEGEDTTAQTTEAKNDLNNNDEI